MSDGFDAIRPPEKLSATHNLSDFDSEEPVLDDWLRRPPFTTKRAEPRACMLSV